MKVFSGSSNKPLAEKIAKELGIPLSMLEIHVFPDGEKRVRIEDLVVDEDCIVVESTGMPVDENYMELCFIVDALKRSGARSVTTVVPYMGYARQDHVFRSGEARSFAVVVKMLEAVGTDRILTFDLHSIKIPELFTIPVEHLSALSLFAEKIKELSSLNSHLSTCLVSPDMGGARRIKLLSEMLDNMPYAVVVKNRDLATGDIAASEVQGEVKETAIIVDDMISTGKTIVQAARLLSEKGASEIFAFATHAVFSRNVPSLLEKSAIEKVYVTDTIEVPKEKRFPKLEILSVAGMISSSLSSRT